MGQGGEEGWSVRSFMWTDVCDVGKESSSSLHRREIPQMEISFVNELLYKGKTHALHVGPFLCLLILLHLGLKISRH